MSVLIAVVKFLVALTVCNAMTMKQIKSTGKMMRKTCQPKNNVADEKIDKMSEGVFVEEKEVMCYVACIMKMANAVKNNKLNYEAAMKQADLLLPEEIKQPAKDAITACRKVVRSDEEIKKSFIEQAAECSKEIPVSGDEFKKITENRVPDNRNAKCLVKCVLHKKGMVDDKGMFDESSSIKMSEKEYEGEVEKIEKSKELYEICRKVNDEPLKDDEEGCERATLLATCLTEHAPKMGFSI